MTYDSEPMPQHTTKGWPLAFRTTCEAIEYTADTYRVHELSVFGAPVLTLRLHLKRCVPETQAERRAKYAAARKRYCLTTLNAREDKSSESGTQQPNSNDASQILAN